MIELDNDHIEYARKLEELSDELTDFLIKVNILPLPTIDDEEYRKEVARILAKIEKVSDALSSLSKERQVFVSTPVAANVSAGDVKLPENPEDKNQGRSARDAGLDLALLKALEYSKDDLRVGLKDLHEIAHLYDPSRGKGSITTKVARWRMPEGKNDVQLVDWTDSNYRYLTAAGREALTDLVKTVRDETKRLRIKNVIEDVLGIKYFRF